MAQSIFDKRDFPLMMSGRQNPSGPVSIGGGSATGGFVSTGGTIGGGGLPEAPNLDPYTPGKYDETPYDESKVRSIAQEEAAGSVRGLRSAIQRISSQTASDPASRMTLRQALAGYGEGMQNAMSSASRSARNAYNTEYNIKENANRINFSSKESANQMNWSAKKEKQYADYNALLQKYFKDNYGGGSGGSSSGGKGYAYAQWAGPTQQDPNWGTPMKDSDFV